MEIEDKQAFKIAVKNKIDKFVWEFPIYFYGNLIINLFLVVIVLSTLFVVALSFRFSGEEGGMFLYGIYIIIFVSFIFRITIKGLFRNIRILKNIYAGDYDFEIEDH